MTKREDILFPLVKKGEKISQETLEKIISNLDIFEDSELPGGGYKFHNTRLHFSTDLKWVQSEGHLSDMIRMQWTGDRAKPALSWCNEEGLDKFAIVGHYMANDAGQPDHVHGSIETTKLDGSLHTRMEFPFDSDICEIQTWGSNFTNNGILRIAGSVSSSRDLVFATANKKADSLDENGRIIPDKMYSKRWSFKANNIEESGNQQGSDLELVNYNDSGTALNAVAYFKRSNGNLGLQNKNPMRALDIEGDAIRIRKTKTPASSTAFGYKGDICWDENYFYVNNGTKWGRIALDYDF